MPPDSGAPNASPHHSSKRSHSEDSAIAEKSKSSGKSRGKKGSQHADVIDRLDFTSVGRAFSCLHLVFEFLLIDQPLPVFHHDGPFDACAPSRNKQRNKAPLYAWTNPPDPVQYGDSAYPSAHAYAAFSNDYPEPPKKKVDAIAEAWGIHEPEPYEEFFAGGGGSTRPDGDTPTSSIYNGRDSHSNPVTRSGLPKRVGDDAQGNKERTRGATRRSLVPPPQPIFVPDPIERLDSGAIPSPDPKRQKSIMQRIRKMRDSPNVPVTSEYDQPSSPNSAFDQPYSPTQPTRPSHKSQNSFLGRFGNKAQPQSADKPEPFVLIEPLPSSNKDLPPAPTMNVTSSGESAQHGSPEFGSPGIGRKTSLMKKVGRVVRGTR